MVRHRSEAAALLLCLALQAGCGDATEPETPIVSSTFESSDEGWVVVGDALPASFTPSGGNPGGHVSTTDREAGDIWYWRAPPSILPRLAEAYGGTLRFDLKQSATDEQFNEPDVVIRSGTTSLAYDFRDNPRQRWTTFRVRLHEQAGWVDLTTRQRATKEQLQAVLAAVNSLRIRGEFRTGSDAGALDNVIISR